MTQRMFPEFASESNPTGPVECLGQIFPDDAARRAYFTEQLREKLQDPAFRAIEGFPIGSDDDILALSDPPYYTACPNPFLEDFIRVYGKPYDPASGYHKEPFAADVSQSKNDLIYNAHAYHTKVPHKAIMRYILHYTEPGDIVFDGFCGTGMTGIAAQMCGAANVQLRTEIEREVPDAQWGMRHALVGDLSPAASFIAHCYNSTFDAEIYTHEARRVMRETLDELRWAYTTIVAGQQYPVDYFVFSDVFICDNCSHEIVFLDAAMAADGTVNEPFACPTCGASAMKRKLTRAEEMAFDPFLQSTIQRAKSQLV